MISCLIDVHVYIRRSCLSITVLLEEAERIVIAEMPVIPIYFYTSKRLIKPWVGGFVPNVMDHTFSKDLYILKRE